MNWRRAILPALVILPLLVLFASRFGSDPHALPSVLVGQPAPPFALRTLSGELVRLEDLRGTPVVLNFWSTFCEPCKLEHELLQDAAVHYEGRVRFFGVVYQDTAEAVSAYLTTKTNRYPNLLDPASQVAIEYGVGGVPESYFIDARGVVRHKQVGVVSAPLVLEQVEGMLAAGGS